MTTLKFADTHNMVVFLSKPAESEGFEQIVDFLNARPIRHALTVNPTIYILCIEQFWATVKAKTVNGEVQLQALVDGKKIIITESTVRRDLQLEDAEGVDCLPNATIFKQLALMGYEQVSQKLTFYKAFFSLQWKFLIHIVLQCLSPKTTAWNEFSSTMASAIICLATNQKFNFSKFIFESMVKNLDNVGKILMYPRHVADEAVNEEMDDSLERVATTATSLDAEQDREKKGGSRTHKLKRLYKVGRSTRVISSDEASLGDQEDASKQGRIADIDADAVINLVNTHFDADTDMFRVHDLVGDEVVVETKVSSKDVNLSVDEVTLAQALTTLKSLKPKADKVMLQKPEQGIITTTTAATTVTAANTRPKAKGLVIHEEEQVTTPIVSLKQPSQLNVQDNGKGKMVEPEKPMKKKELIRLDEEIASKLQAEFDEEVRLAREKAEKEEEANIVS
ncbi:hypothetical protein Tco_0133709 [Tanacetum coccineum]